MYILVTGGAGFIGSNFVHYLVKNKLAHPIVLDKLTYAADLKNFWDLDNQVDYSLVDGDINDRDLVFNLLATYDPIGIVHFAAESHVDNSIADSSPFIHSNVLGTVALLEATRKWLDERHKYTLSTHSFRFHHVSTDEVYGSLNATDPAFTETTPYDPRSPYSASKAASDHFVTAWGNTYKIPYTISNCSNNYGPRQFHEKLVPTVIRKAIEFEPIPMYGDGSNIRDWIHVDDHCDAIWQIFTRGRIGEKYNVGGKCQMSNKILISNILSMLGRSTDLIKSVADRPGHDFRYDIDNTKIETELGWTPKTNFLIGLSNTVRWYVDKRREIAS